MKNHSLVQEVVLGGGGIKGFGHLGVLKALEERQSSIETITGISIGAVVAAFYANGYSTDEIAEILFEELGRLHPRNIEWKLSTPISLLFGQGLFDLQKIFSGLAERYELEPQENLRILAYNMVTRRPVYFQGRNIDLHAAIAASCAVPVVMRPVWVGGSSTVGKAVDCVGGWLGLSSNGLMVDGGMHHPNPGPEDAGKIALVSKLGFASDLPAESLHLVDLVFHLLEMAGGPLLRSYFPDPEAPGNIIVEAAPQSVACLTFGLSEKQCLTMIDHGYANARKALSVACRKGLVGPLQRSRKPRQSR